MSAYNKGMYILYTYIYICSAKKMDIQSYTVKINIGCINVCGENCAVLLTINLGKPQKKIFF